MSVEIIVEGRTENQFKRDLGKDKFSGVSVVDILPAGSKESCIYIDLKKLPPETDRLMISVKELG